MLSKKLFKIILISFATLAMLAQSPFWNQIKWQVSNTVPVIQNNFISIEKPKLTPQENLKLKGDSCVYIILTISYMEKFKLWNEKESLKWLKSNNFNFKSQKFQDCMYIASIEKYRISYSLLSIPLVYLFGIYGFLIIPIIFYIFLIRSILQICDAEKILHLSFLVLFVCGPISYYATMIGPETLIYFSISYLVRILMLKGNATKNSYISSLLIVTLATFSKMTVPYTILFLVNQARKEKISLKNIWLSMVFIQFLGGLAWIISDWTRKSAEIVLNNPNPLLNLIDWSQKSTGTELNPYSLSNDLGQHLSTTASDHISTAWEQSNLSPLNFVSEINELVTRSDLSTMYLFLIGCIYLLDKKSEVKFFFLTSLFAAISIQNFHAGNFGLNFRYLLIPLIIATMNMIYCTKGVREND